ncbi:MAG TPA: flagellar biosynthesis repressor FlbT [Hyphomicrobiaceae bacterium]|jgi:flagellar protein FlbT
MTNTLKISLKANEKIYINGAVIRPDRKVSLEFLNDVQFLLEQHVLQVEDADTPLRQLYFIVQVMLMQPDDTEEARAMFRETLTRLLGCFTDQRILASLKDLDRLVGQGQIYEALKLIRRLYPLEAEIMNGERGRNEPPRAIAVGE